MRKTSVEKKIITVKMLILVSCIIMGFLCLKIWNINFKKTETVANNKMYEIYIETGFGTDTYTTYTSNVFPTEGYVLNTSLTTCIGGGTISQESSSINALFNSSDSCKLYFDVDSSAVSVIKGMVKNYSDATTDVITLNAPSGGNCTNTLAYDGTSDNNLRYVGANPCNYVSFNSELWRIIGIFNGKLKIIRNDSLGSYSWDSSASSVNSGCGINQWGSSGNYEGADLMRELNGDYLDTTLTSNTLWYGSDGTQLLQFEYTKVIKSDAQNMIANSIWNTGSPTTIRYDCYASTLYEGERSNNTGKICSINSNYNGVYCTDTVTRTSTWTGKVGLIYPSDFVFATSGGTTTDRSTCLVTSSNTWGYSSVSDCKNNDWLVPEYASGNYTLTSVMNEDFADQIALLTNQGTFNSTRAKERAEVYPTVFLKSNVPITGGAGTEQNPYTLS